MKPQRRLLEKIVMGVAIGLVVMAIRLFVVGSASQQFWALLLAALLLCMVQLALLIRRPPAEFDPPDSQGATNHVHANPPDPFAIEKTPDWLGLLQQPDLPHTPHQPPSEPAIENNQRSDETMV